MRSPQLNYLINFTGLHKGAPIAAPYLELGILPTKYEIKMRQILYLKKVFFTGKWNIIGRKLCKVPCAGLEPGT